MTSLATSVPNFSPICAPSRAWIFVPGASHDGYPVLYQPATGDVAYDALQDPYPVALPPAVEAAIRQQYALPQVTA